MQWDCSVLPCYFSKVSAVWIFPSVMFYCFIWGHASLLTNWKQNAFWVWFPFSVLQAAKEDPAQGKEPKFLGKAGWVKKAQGRVLSSYKDRYMCVEKSEVVVYENEVRYIKSIIICISMCRIHNNKSAWPAIMYWYFICQPFKELPNESLKTQQS